MKVSEFFRSSPLADMAMLLLAGIAIVVIAGQAFPELDQGAPCLWDIFNDQFNYLSTAHNLADEGRLQSDLIYPSLLREKNAFAFLYAPGTPVVFAAAYAVFGEGIISIVTPGVLAYLLGALAVWYAASRLTGRLAGMVAGLLYLTFPMHAAFLHTAMTEQLLGAACAIVLAVACARARPSFTWLAAAALLPAIMLRETALAYFVILAGLGVARAGGAPRLVSLAAPVLGLVAGLVLVWGLLGNHPSLLLPNLLVDSTAAVYFDAYALDDISVGAASVADALAGRLDRNTAILFSTSMLNPEEHAVIGIMLGVLGVSLILGFLRRDWFLLSLGLTGIFAIVLLASMYKIEYFKGSRFLAFLWPASCVAIASMVPHLRSIGAGFAATLIIISLLTSQSLIKKRAIVCEDWFERADLEEQILNLYDTGRSQTIVAEGMFGMSWVLGGTDKKWAFLPTNIETFRLLRQRAGADLVVLKSRSKRSELVELLRAEGYEVLASHHLDNSEYILLAPTVEK